MAFQSLDISLSKLDSYKKIGYAEVYAPNTLDTHGDFMTANDIEEMAHEFLRKANLDRAVDTMHDNVPNGVEPVESFIARAGDPDFTEGAWVIGLKFSDEIWAKVVDGTYGGLSMEVLAKRVPAIVTAEIPTSSIGSTSVSENHSHLFIVELSDDGKVIGGRTSVDFGHSHEIKNGAVTEKSYGHAHRFSLD